MVMNQINDRTKARAEEARISGYARASAAEARVGLLRGGQQMLTGRRPTPDGDGAS
jgi:hypothetical protein